MVLDVYKELKPVMYGQLCARFLPNMQMKSGQECFRLHWHERMELLRIREGSMMLQIADERREVCAGQLVLICPCQPHYGQAGSQGVRYDVIMFEPEHLRSETDACIQYLDPLAKGSVTFLSVTDDPELLGIADRLVEQYGRRESINPLRIVAGIYELLAVLYERYPPSQRMAGAADDSFRHVVEFVNANYTQEMTTSSLSRRFGYNEAYFCRRFKKATGLNATKYIQILRLEHARRLLEKSGDPLALLAARSGFSDIYHFTHCFTRHFGVSPNAYRQSVRRQYFAADP